MTMPVGVGVVVMIGTFRVAEIGVGAPGGVYELVQVRLYEVCAGAATQVAVT